MSKIHTKNDTIQLNNFIIETLREITKKQLINNIEKDIALFMEALKQKNKIYDFAFKIENYQIFKFKITLVYSFYNTEKLIDAENHEEVLEFILN